MSSCGDDDVFHFVHHEEFDNVVQNGNIGDWEEALRCRLIVHGHKLAFVRINDD